MAGIGSSRRRGGAFRNGDHRPTGEQEIAVLSQERDKGRGFRRQLGFEGLRQDYHSLTRLAECLTNRGFFSFRNEEHFASRIKHV